MTNAKCWSILLTLAATVLVLGCTGPAPPAAPGAGTTNGGGHTHTHDGPHGGHVMVLGKEEYHAEWTHEEGGKVTFYILDADAAKEVPIAAEEITIDAKIGNNPPATYKLTAVNPQDGKAAAFELTSPDLETVLEQLKAPNVTCTLHVNVNGKQFDQEIKEEEHTADHKH
jgi:hypothetical protein